MENEIRSLKGELRAAPDFTLQGTAARFNTRSSDLGGFVETIAPGAFTRSLKVGAKVVVTVNHDPNQVLGSTKSGTAKVWSDDSGLRFLVKLDPANTIHSNAYASVKRGDMDSCSFAFKVPKGGDTFAPDTDANGNPTILRTLTDVDLIDASIVTYPAYPEGTAVNARALEARGLLRVASFSKAPITPEILARSQGMTVSEMNARSDEARRSVARAQAKKISVQTDADRRAKATRLGAQIAADAAKDKADDELRVRMEIASGRVFSRRSKAADTSLEGEEGAGGEFNALQSALQESYPDHKLLGYSPSQKQAYSQHTSGMKFTVPYEQDAAGNYSFGKPALGGHPITLSDVS